MITQKLKICSVCHDPCILWVSTPKMCKSCATWAKINTEKETKPTYKGLKQTEGETTAKPFKVGKAIKRVGDKRAKRDRVYNVAAPLFKKNHPECMAKLEGCGYVTMHVHHQYSGASRDKFYLDTTTWIAVCDNCHHLIHDVMSKEELFELGLKKTDI